MNKTLKVLLISPLPPPVGGIASWTKQFIEWSHKHRIAVEIVNTALSGKRAKNINSKFSIFDEFSRTISIIYNLKRKINDFHPSVIHLNSPCGKLGIIRDFYCARIAKKRNIYLIVHFRCNIEDQISTRMQMKYFEKLILIADVIFVQNEFSQKYLKSKHNINSELMPNFIVKNSDEDYRKNVKNRIENILFVGHVQRSKGVLEIIKVALKCPEYVFYLAGPVSPEISIIEKPTNVFFLGSLDKASIFELMKMSDLFLFPTYTEGFSNAMLEAMLYGLPIITTNVGANQSMIEDKGGIIVSQNSPNEIVNAIKLLEPIEVRKRILDWNFKKVSDFYEIDKVMYTLIKYYLRGL